MSLNKNARICIECAEAMTAAPAALRLIAQGRNAGVRVSHYGGICSQCVGVPSPEPIAEAPILPVDCDSPDHRGMVRCWDCRHGKSLQSGQHCTPGRRYHRGGEWRRCIRFEPASW